MLSWKTASEENNEGFEVLHKGVEAGSFKKIGDREGTGTTGQTQSYSFRTGELDVGTHAFRLRQVDTDGDETLSEPVQVKVGVAGEFELSKVYPNSVRGGAKARLDLAVSEAQEVEAVAYDALDQHVATLFEGSLESNDVQELQFEAEGFASACTSWA